MFKSSGVFLVSMLLMQVILGVVAGDLENSGEMDDDIRPSKTRTVAVLRSQGDMLKYLNYINQYYAIRGRPRFGKRSWESESGQSSFD